VSAEEKVEKRKSEGKVSAAAAAIPKILKFDTANVGISASAKFQDSKEDKSEDSSEPSEDENLGKPAGKANLADRNGYVDTGVDVTELGLSPHATRSDLTDLLVHGGVQYDQLVEQLRLSRLANANSAPALAIAPASQQTMIVSDISSFHITGERVNAVEFKRLRDKCNGERRSRVL
jgi:hypothetical protein